MDYSENKHQRFTELEDAFIRKHYYYGGRDIIGKVLGRDSVSVMNYCARNGIKCRHGERSKSYEELKAIWDEANRRVNSPIERELPHTAVVNDGMAPRHEPAPERKSDDVHSEPASGICPCAVDETIIVKRTTLIGGGEVWICARCGRQIAIRRGKLS